MCGRFALGIPRKKLRERFALEDLPDAPPRFNVAPGQLVEAILEPDTPAGVPRRAGLFRWGLVPSWARDPAVGARMINARAETAAEKPAFRAAIRRRRCLVPAQGFYEWSGPPKRRQPWFLTPVDGSVMALAAIWEHWESPGGEIIESLAVLTCEANGLVAPIHGRMPVAVRPEDDARWLDPRLQDPRGVEDILAPREWPEMKAYRVSPRVNAAANEGPDLIEPWPPLGGGDG